MGKIFALASLSAAILATPVLDLFGPEPPLEDFLSFHFAAIDLRTGSDPNPWDFDELRAAAAATGFRGRIYPYLYPPVLAWAWQPFTHDGLLHAKRVWLLASIVAACLGCGVLGATMSGARRASAVAVGASLCVLIAGWRGNLIAGQSNAFVGLCIAIAAASIVSGRDRTAGAAIAIATLLKLTPAILLAHFVVRRQWRALAFFAAVVTVAITGTIVSGGARVWLHFFEAAPAMAHGQTIPGLFPPEVIFNVSLAGAIARWIHDPGWIRVLTLWTLLLLGVASTARSRASAAGPAELAPFAALASLMVLGSPFGYWHHALLLAPAAGCVLAFSSRSQAWALPAVLVLLAGAAIELPAVFHRLGADTTNRWLAGLGTWIHLALWGAFLAWSPRAHRVSTGGPRERNA